jgi:hypothetical protein
MYRRIKDQRNTRTTRQHCFGSNPKFVKNLVRMYLPILRCVKKDLKKEKEAKEAQKKKKKKKKKNPPIKRSVQLF